MRELSYKSHGMVGTGIREKECIGVITTTIDRSGEEDLIPIPVYDEEYGFKYYINGNWYEDAAGTIPWTSSLI